MADDRTLPRIDTTRAHPARIYDSWLGGKDIPVRRRQGAKYQNDHPERILAPPARARS
jgi:S-adenosyl methyltransferase